MAITNLNAKFIKGDSEFQLATGQFMEDAVLNPNVVAKMNRTTGNLETINANETYNSLDTLGWHVNEDGQRCWTDPANQVFGTEKTGGSYPYGTYKQSNIYITTRKYAGKDSLYGVHVFRYPNISSSSTWGGLIIYPPAASKLRGHKYRFSFDYRGNTGGASLDVYQSYTAGWGTIGIDLRTPWSQGVSTFDTDWEWRRYEKDFEIDDYMLDFIPGSLSQAWNSTTSYPGGWYGITYNGYVYRKNPGVATTVGLTPEQEYQNGGVYNGKYPMTSGYFDLYKQIKIGFTYNTQYNRGTSVYLDNIQLTDITTNETFKFNGSGWESDNMAEKTTHVVVKSHAHVTLAASGTSNDIGGVDLGTGQQLTIDGNLIYSNNARGLRLTVWQESDKTIVHDMSYDTYGDNSRRTALASRLSTIQAGELWTLSSYDAINPNAALDSQMASMGSVLLVADGNEYSVYNSGVRAPYAAIGRGQTIIKEDGSAASDAVYKRKGVIDLKV